MHSFQDTVTKRVCAQSCLTLCDPWTLACQAPLSMGFPRQEHWTGLPFPSSGDLLNPGIKPTSPVLAGGFFTIEPPRKSNSMLYASIKS